MSINSKIENYQRFFLDQVKEAELEQKTTIKSPINQLVRKEEIVIGYVDHINEKLGHVVLKFPKDKAPRLKVQKSIMVVKKNAKAELGERIPDWGCTFLDFCKNVNYHSSSSDILPLYYQKGADSSYDYVGCTGISLTMFDLFRDSTTSGKHLTVLIYAPFPPVDYFNNLAHFLDVFGDIPELLTEPKMDYEDWSPEELEYNPQNENAISERVMETLADKGCCVLQGPPGTGKSFTIAHIIADYLNAGKTVCVTTMANKGLIELVQQPPLLPFLKEGRISKSNLTADEKRIVKGIKPIKKGFVIPNGELFCSTNYVLSQAYNANNLVDDGLPSYDLVVIEEASQAFLTSLIAFKKLGKECLIVGDPMQLPPIISNPNKAIYKAWRVGTQVDGLRTFALGTDVKAFRITTTFRLTPASARLTGIFYNNRFRSVQKEELDFSKCHSPLFPKGGGALYFYTSDFTNGVISGSALSIISEVVDLIHRNYPKRSLAIISPFNDSVKQLQKHFLSDADIEDITIETIDRIQGMTVDYAILYVPGRNPGFALDERRFNVATSRSRSTTLIISDIPLENLHSIPAKVTTFIGNSSCYSVGNSIKDNSLSDIEESLEQNDIKALYPGLEDIVDLLLKNNIEFSHDGDVDLLDQDGVVIASAGLLLHDYKIAIDPIDDISKKVFEDYGYKTISSGQFDINMIK